MLEYLISKSRIFVLCLLLFLLVSFTFIFRITNSKSSILGTVDCPTSPCELEESPINISGFIASSDLKIRVFPEKRIPKIGNWDTVLDVDLVSCTNGNTYSINDSPSNIEGYADLDLSINNVPTDEYKFFVTGYSHLTEEFDCYSVSGNSEIIDLSLENKDLLAGEISTYFDNYINALDISVMVKDLYTTEYLSDLNQDGEVNSLDLSNQIYNLYKAGD